ncbi:MAG: hypothetical protein ACXIU7_06445 [Roseinatronobacter sp.]
MIGDLTEFAVQGDLGVDVFRRVTEKNQRRARYECLATLSAEGAVIGAYHDIARHAPERMRAAARRLQTSAVLAQPISLAKPASYPRAQASGPDLSVFLYLDFFRSWQVAEQEISRIERRLLASGSRAAAPTAVVALPGAAGASSSPRAAARVSGPEHGAGQRPALGPSALDLSAPEISAVLRLLLDFNQIHRAAPILRGLVPELLARAARGQEDRWQNTGFALRMCGDLRLRAGLPAPALECYEAALVLGDNAHRRGLAIRAAHAAQDHAALGRHLAAFRADWCLPEDLVQIAAQMPAPASAATSPSADPARPADAPVRQSSTKSAP